MATASYPTHNLQGNAGVRLYGAGHAVVQAGATDLDTGALKTSYAHLTFM